MGTNGYAWQARLYDRVLEPMNAPLRRVSRRLVAPPPGGVVLDVGCGTGAALAEYRETGCHVLGADTSPAMLAQARARLGDEADLRLMRGSSVPFEDACADLVLVSLVLHSLTASQARGLLDEVARVLAPEGTLLVTDFGTDGLRFPRGWATRAVTVLSRA